MFDSLEGRSAIVTGGTRGIGRAIADALAPAANACRVGLVFELDGRNASVVVEPHGAHDIDWAAIAGVGIGDQWYVA